VLVNVDSKSTPPLDTSAVTVAVNGKKQPLSAWNQVPPADAEVALLIDDGLLPTVVYRELDNLRSFVRTLPPGVKITIGYMHNNQVTAPPFTADHVLASSYVRLPQGMAGLNSNPYISISYFVKNWPASASPTSSTSPATSSPRKARFLLMLTDGVDPTYSHDQADAGGANQGGAGAVAATSQAQLQSQAAQRQLQSQNYQLAQQQSQEQGQTAQLQSLAQQSQVQGRQAQIQESPFVKAAVEDAQRAGVAINEIYYSNESRTGGLTYLLQVTQATGGTNYFEGGKGNPLSTGPFLQQFQHSIAETYIATFNAPVVKNQKDMIGVKFSASNAKFHATEKVHVGNQ
jgi:hypothetical protein